MDLGPDGVCATNACEYFWHMNIDRWNDAAHGTNVDHPAVLKTCGLYNFWLCMAVSWNLVFGPDRNHQRKHELSGALKALYRKVRCVDCPLFMANSVGIVACLR